MKQTGEPYSVARRVVLELDDPQTEKALERLFDDIRADLAGRFRWMVPHGFEENIQGRRFSLRLPVIWKPLKGASRATASDEPSADNLEEVRALIESRLASGRYLPASQLISWSTEMPRGPRPSDLDWTVTASV